MVRPSRGPAQPPDPPPSHLLSGQQGEGDDMEDDEDIPMHERRMDPCAVRLKNLAQFAEAGLVSSWLIEFCGPPMDRTAM